MLIADFGISRPSVLVKTCIGTQWYMAPEQYGGLYDFRADMWSAACVFWVTQEPQRASIVFEGWLCLTFGASSCYDVRVVRFVLGLFALAAESSLSAALPTRFPLVVVDTEPPKEGNLTSKKYRRHPNGFVIVVSLAPRIHCPPCIARLRQPGQKIHTHLLQNSPC